MGCSSAAGVLSEAQKQRPSETSPEQLLGHDQPMNAATDLIQATVVGRSFTRWDTVNIVSVNSVIYDCCKLFLS